VDPTLRTAGGRHVLRLERRLAHPPEKVWRALTDPAQLASWFPSTVRGELRAGAMIDFDADGDAASTGEVLVADPPRVLAFTWDADVLRFELRPDGAGTVLALEHTFDDRPAAASYGAGWQVCLGALGVLLDGRPEAPPGTSAEAWATMHAAHEALVTPLGLGEGTVQDTPDGRRVRFVRQLTSPAPRVWALLGGADAAVGGPVPVGATAPGLQAATVNAVEPPTRLAYGWRAGGRVAGEVTLELSEGPGGAARLVLTQTGPRDVPDARTTALTTWTARISELSSQLGAPPAA
jgi:uncharacterized protein YndB with AHSA1/START domain